MDGPEHQPDNDSQRSTRAGPHRRSAGRWAAASAREPSESMDEVERNPFTLPSDEEVFKLRDEDEIANERREGSSMSKGGKADFVSAAKTKGNDDMVDF